MKTSIFGIDRESARSAWSYAAVLILLWSVFCIRKTILLFALALIFAYLLYPLVEFTQRHLKLKARFWAVMLPFAMILLLSTTGCIILHGPLLKEGHNLELQVASTEFKKNLAHWQPFGIPLGEKIAEAEGMDRIQNQVMGFMPQVGKGLSQAGRDIGNIFIIPILAFFMLKDGRQICDCILDLCFHPRGTGSSLAVRRTVLRIMDDAHALILQYMRSLVLLCFAVLIVFSVALKTMGVRYALLLALLASALEFIPLIGPMAAGLIILAVSAFNHYPHRAGIVVFLLVFRLFQDYVLSPQLMRSSLKLHPLLVIFAVFAGGEIGGIGGVFLSVPLLALARLVFYEYRRFTEGVTTTDEQNLSEGEAENWATAPSVVHSALG